MTSRRSLGSRSESQKSLRTIIRTGVRHVVRDGEAPAWAGFCLGARTGRSSGSLRFDISSIDDRRGQCPPRSADRPSKNGCAQLSTSWPESQTDAAPDRPRDHTGRFNPPLAALLCVASETRAGRGVWRRCVPASWSSSGGSGAPAGRAISPCCQPISPSSTERWIRTRRPRLTAGSSPASIRLRTVCGLSFSSWATWSTVRRSSVDSAPVIDQLMLFEPTRSTAAECDRRSFWTQRCEDRGVGRPKVTLICRLLAAVYG